MHFIKLIYVNKKKCFLLSSSHGSQSALSNDSYTQRSNICLTDEDSICIESSGLLEESEHNIIEEFMQEERAHHK